MNTRQLAGLFAHSLIPYTLKFQNEIAIKYSHSRRVWNA